MLALLLFAGHVAALPVVDGGAVVIAIDLDGKRYLTGRLAGETTGIPRGEDPNPQDYNVAWRRYSVTPMRPEPGIEVPTEPGDPLHATLRGQVHINVKQSYELTVLELRLVRSSVDADWVIAKDPEPVDAWLRGEGAMFGPILRWSENPFLWIGISAASILILAIWWIGRRRNLATTSSE